MYSIPLLIYDMGDSTEEPFAVDTGAGCSEVFACYMGNSREAGLVGPPVVERAILLEDGDFPQVCMHLKKKTNVQNKHLIKLILFTFLQSPIFILLIVYAFSCEALCNSIKLVC